MRGYSLGKASGAMGVGVGWTWDGEVGSTLITKGFSSRTLGMDTSLGQRETCLAALNPA